MPSVMQMPNIFNSSLERDFVQNGLDLISACPKFKTMPESKNLMKEVLPKQGLLYQEDMPTVVLCKPKILPLKSVTLEKLEKMQKEAQETIKQQEKEASLHGDNLLGGI